MKLSKKIIKEMILEELFEQTEKVSSSKGKETPATSKKTPVKSKEPTKDTSKEKTKEKDTKEKESSKSSVKAKTTTKKGSTTSDTGKSHYGKTSTKKGKKDDEDELEEAKQRNYKEEYKKYGSSTKAKKYRAELNKYNRQKGTYGNGDGKDASHKGGKIVGFEKESVNRGRAEKSRLKKEQKITEDYKNNKWEVYVADKNRREKVVKVAKSKRAAVILYNKLIKTDKYHEVGMRVIEEGKLTEGLKRFKVFVSGHSEPLILMGKNEKDVKHIAHQMIQNSSVKIRKVVKEGKLNEMNFDKVKLPSAVERYLNRYIQSMKDANLNRMKRAAALYKVIDGAGFTTQQLMQDIQKIKKQLGEKYKDNPIEDIVSIKQYLDEGGNVTGTHGGDHTPISADLMQYTGSKLSGIDGYTAKSNKIKKKKKKKTKNIKTRFFQEAKKETAIDIAKRVVQNKQHEKGLDLTTANFIMQIYNAYKKNPALQKKLEKMPLKKMIGIVYKLIK